MWGGNIRSSVLEIFKLLCPYVIHAGGNAKKGQLPSIDYPGSLEVRVEVWVESVVIMFGEKKRVNLKVLQITQISSAHKYFKRL